VVGINIARAGRVASLSLPASVVVGLIDDLKSGRLAPPAWRVSSWQSTWDELEARIASLQSSLREAEQARHEAEHRLLKSETVVRQALVAKAAAELRQVDAQRDMVKRLQAAAERRAAERAIRLAEAPFEEARLEVEAAHRTLHELRTALAAARREKDSLQAE
jgi:hypothetical protein